MERLVSHGPATTSLQDGQFRTLKHDDTFAVFDHSGDALAGPSGPEGLYNCDTRFLSHLQLTVEQSQPKLLSSGLSDDNTTFTCDLTNPDLYDAGGKLALPQGSLHFRRSFILWEAGLFGRMAITNFGDRPRRIRIEVAFAADFADLFEVRGTKRRRHGQHHPPAVGSDRVTLSYTGLDKKRLTTAVRFFPTPARLTGDMAVFDVEVPARQTQIVFIEVSCNSEGTRRPVPASFLLALRDSRRALRTRCAQAAGVTTSNDVFNRTVSRSISDLYTLTTNLPSGPYPYAGIPWFSTVFGRDALITAWEMLWFDPTIARGVLRHLALNQATEENPAADAEPGKILHEARGGEMASLGEVPFKHYYGSVDSTPLFLFLAGAYLTRTGDLDFIRGLAPHLEAATAWLDAYGDRDGDGFVEYGSRTAKGLTNQGWKDSYDAVFHADGTLARGPIALAEVQGYVYGARLAMADILERTGQASRAREQAARAQTLREQFDRHFFDEELGAYVLALDGDKRPCRVRTSNAGHALFSGIAYPERAASVVKCLMTSDSFSGWGVRTVASREARYNPISYHDGSVWPHDNAMIAAGFSRYGFRREAARIFEGLFAASTYIDLQRLPELFCGFPRRRGQGPTFYPVACSPQAWAAAAPLSLLQSSIGLVFDADAGEIVFDHPVLPEFLDDITLRRLSLGGKAIDVVLKRAGRQTVVEVLAGEEGLGVVNKSGGAAQRT
ncbi:amylo-alpha-1,6-glucosidase [Labrys monachus]|uniref:amylo-alpha-1,6-glucosidase n=1 Tax=Labrys monachus TaxID=217067 RepID=UPI0035216A1D